MDWSQPDRTSRILQYAVISIPVTWLVYFIIPFNYILLAGGLVAFLHSSRKFNAASIYRIPVYLVSGLLAYLGSIIEALRGLEPIPIGREKGVGRAALMEQEIAEPIPVTVAVFENQRWWAGPGWVPHLLSNERPLWSDGTGKATCPPPSEYQLPGPDWTWLDADWGIDGDWMETDAEGWVYR